MLQHIMNVEPKIKNGVGIGKTKAFENWKSPKNCQKTTTSQKYN